MRDLNKILHDLGISKVKLAKFLGVSRQMVYNYLELGNIDKWPKDKKVLLLNLLGVKSVEEISKIKINTDYITDVEVRLSSLSQPKEDTNKLEKYTDLYEGLDKKKKELLINIVNIMKDGLEDNDIEEYNSYRYLYYFLQSMNNTKELRYILAYIAKVSGYIKADEYAFDEKEQFDFESILFSAFSLYESKNFSPAKMAVAHNNFVKKIETKKEEILGRTQRINAYKALALKELNYSEINTDNLSEVLQKMEEIEARNIMAK